MKDKRKILLGTKDVLPQVNNDIYINLEINKSSDEIKNEIINNNFNIREQFNKERRESLKFCFYGTLNSIYSDTNDLTIEVKTNHNDILYSPRIEPGTTTSIVSKIKSVPLSKNNKLTKNIFQKNKSCFHFLFEIGSEINNYGETKILEVKVIDESKNIYAFYEIPFLFFDSEGNFINFGTDTVDLDLNGNEQIIENDFPFLYGIHWIKNEFNLPRPLKASFVRSEFEELNNLTVNEKVGKVKFYVKLDSPSIYGTEELEVYIDKDYTTKNPNNDFKFENQILKWEKGEQIKEVNLEIIDDLFVEDNEKIIFGLRNLKFVEQDKNNTFELTIQNDDLPSPIGFVSNQLSVSSGGKIVVLLESDIPIRVPNQTVDLILDESISDVIIGVDIENTGTEDEPEFRKTIELKQGLSLFEVEIRTNLKEELKYSLSKTAIFKLDQSTQNIEIKSSSNNLNLQLEDSMIKRYTTFKIDNNPLKGQGIFRLSNPSPQYVKDPLNFVNTNIYSKFNFTNNFKYKIKIINKAEPIIFKNQIINNGEIVTTISSNDGYQNFSFTLPSNYLLNKQNKFFEKSKYEFVIYDIEDSSKIISINKDYIEFNDLIIKDKILDSSLEFTGKLYYLTSEITKVKTRLDNTPNLKKSKETYEIIKKAKIKVTDSEKIIKQKLKVFNKLKFDENKINSTTIDIINFFKEYPTLELPSFFISTDSLSSLPIDCKINGTILLSKKFDRAIKTGVNNIPNTQLKSVQFEEEPVDYIYSTKEDGTNYYLMPVQPLNKY